MGRQIRGGVFGRRTVAPLLRADGTRTNVARSSLRRFVGIAFVFRMDGGTDLFGIGISASWAICGAVCSSICNYSVFDFAFTGCFSASDACARNYLRITYNAEHFGVFSVCAGCRFERDISFAESITASKKTGRDVLAIPGAGCFGADEPKFRAGGNSGADCRDDLRIYLGESFARTLLEWRSEGNYFTADVGLLRDVFDGFAADSVAWRAGGDVLHVQFCIGAV